MNKKAREFQRRINASHYSKLVVIGGVSHVYTGLVIETDKTANEIVLTKDDHVIRLSAYEVGVIRQHLLRSELMPHVGDSLRCENMPTLKSKTCLRCGNSCFGNLCAECLR